MAPTPLTESVTYPGDHPKTVSTDFNEMKNGSSLSPGQTIFVNNSLNMAEIKAVGFDMDYTMAQYVSPQFETLGFDLAKKQMTPLGYPEIFEAFEYDPNFSKRGLWFDKLLGNLVKVDGFGNILTAFHGFRVLSQQEILGSYPEKLDNLDKSRVFVMHTLFNLPETYLVACIIDFYDNSAVEFREDGWQIDGKIITFRKIFEDIRSCIDDIHVGSMSLKTTAISNLGLYVKKDPELPAMLEKIRSSGKTVFLLTNSDWWYTNNIMKFLLEDDNNSSSWTSFFDFTFLDAGKPSFFSSGSPLHQVDTTTGRLCALDQRYQRIAGQTVFSGGSTAILSSLIGARSNSILYAGDHLHADVVMARKLGNWRTLMITPELQKELEVLENPECSSLHLQKLEDQLKTGESQDKERLGLELENAERDLNKRYGTSGSIFREGKRLTMFGSLMQSWADIYTGSVLNMIHYDNDHSFVANVPHLPHES